jgi:hypothetical protein
LAVEAPEVVILPVEKQGELLVRVDNPQLLDEEEWFRAKSKSCRGSGVMKMGNLRNKIYPI